jgi:hypothetical protein
MPWTKERVTELLNTNDLAVERAVVALFERQTADEKATNDTRHDNTVGFSAAHARTLSFYAKVILAGWKREGKNKTHLFPNKLAKARRFVTRYSRQLCDIANAKEQAALRGPAFELSAEAAAKITRGSFVAAGDGTLLRR